MKSRKLLKIVTHSHVIFSNKPSYSNNTSASLHSRRAATTSFITPVSLQMAHPKYASSVIQQQPTVRDIHSNFKLFPGEDLLFESTLKTGCCDMGTTYFTTVTDTRYVNRQEEYVCCGQKPYSEQCIYLHDIAELQEQKKNCTSANWCCKLCCSPCSCMTCCCTGPKILQFRGSFGNHTVRILGQDIPNFETMMTAAIARQKVSNRY